jgi:hypothetical protein
VGIALAAFGINMNLFRANSVKQLFLLLVLPFSLYAYRGTTELRVGYFYPVSSVIREIYESGVEGEIETAVRVYGRLHLFANGGFFTKEGRSLGFKNKTRINLFPLSLGLKYHFTLLPVLEFYLGAAPTYTWAYFHDYSPYVKEHVHKSAFGGVGKLGFIYTFWKMAFADFFFDYYYTRISGVHSPGVTSTNRDIGGFRTGLGIGFKY